MIAWERYPAPIPSAAEVQADLVERGFLIHNASTQGTSRWTVDGLRALCSLLTAAGAHATFEGNLEYAGALAHSLHETVFALQRLIASRQ